MTTTPSFFTYTLAVKGQNAFWESTPVIIRKLYEEADGSKHGRVKVVDAGNGETLGRVCIHHLAPLSYDLDDSASNDNERTLLERVREMEQTIKQLQNKVQQLLKNRCTCSAE